MLIGYLVIRSLPLRRGAVWAAAFVFSLGTLTIVTAIIRCVILLHSIDGGGSISLMKYTFLLSQIESTVAGVAACLPAFRVFLRASSVASTAGGPGSSGNREAKQSSINELSLATIGGTGGRRQAHSADSDLEDLGGSDIDLVYPDHRTSGPTSTMV